MDKEKATANMQIKHLEDLNSPEIYASFAPFFSIQNGVVAIVLSSRRWGNSRTPAIPFNVVVARLVMPLSGAQCLAIGLNDFLEKQGYGFVSEHEKAHQQ